MQARVMSSPPFTADLLAWYDAAAVALPWRGASDPYLIWLSEIMLQQTQIETVRPYYARFLAAYPTVHDLAAAPLDEVLKLWEGLGYYSRARNLHRAAQVIAFERDGVWPSTVDDLLTLPGVGRYTAGAIASIAFGVRAPVLDGNVIRVLSRVHDYAADVTTSAAQADLWRLAADALPDTRAGDHNQALMDLGRLICTPRAPRCPDCPIRAHCRAYTAGTVDQRPVKPKKAPTPHYDVAAGLVWDDHGRVLIAQRPADGLLGGLWEFPGGKQEAGETLPECLRRELREELAIAVDVGELVCVVRHAFTHFKITLHAFTCRHVNGDPQLIGAQAVAWVTPAELERYAFGKADRAVIAELKARSGRLL